MALSVLYQNTRGLRTKLVEFKQNLYANNPDILCVTESWLKSTIYDHELVDLNQYTVFRRNRETIVGAKSDGGGVFIAVKNKLSAVLLPEFQSGAEDLWISIKLEGNKVLLVCCVYLPPNDNGAYACFSSKLNSLPIRDEHILLVCGDFNVPSAGWVQAEDGHYLEPFNVEPKYSLLLDTFLFHNLLQFNCVFNNNNRLLDLILCNKFRISEISQCTNPLVPEDVHHPCIEFLFDSCLQKPLEFGCNTYLDFKNANFEIINQQIENIDWNLIFHNKSLNSCLDIFYDKIENIIKENIRTYSKNKYFPIFYSQLTIKTILQKNKIHKKWRKYKNINDYNIFKTLRARSKILIRTDYNRYSQSVENDLINNPKRFWNYASVKKQCVSNMPSEIHWEDKSAEGGSDVSDLFGSYFESVFVPESYHFNPGLAVNNLYLHDISLKENEVLKALQGLDPKKGAGPDKLPSIFIKSCASSLCVPLTLLFNQSLKTGIFPERWKTAMIVPIFKGGQKSDISNYCPISKISVIPKLLEKIIYQDFFSLVKNVIISEQHGFFRGRSLETNLFMFCEYLHCHMDKRIQVDAVYTDFSKAFDKISHNVLLSRLAEVGVGGNLLRWVESYVKNRSQYVSVQGFCSKSFVTTSGVPQGSHLGPLFFIIYINKITSCFHHSDFLLYADDLKIYKSITGFDDCNKLQSDLDRLERYCAENGLFFNLAKCVSITFSRNQNQIDSTYHVKNTILKKVNSAKDLGVIFDSKLLFDLNVESIVNSASRMLGYIVRKCRPFRNIKSIICLYNSYVLSKLNFASIIWSPKQKTYIDRLENIQDKFIKYLFLKQNVAIPADDVSLARIHFRLVSLKNRRIMSEVLFMYKIFNNLIHSPQVLEKVYVNVPQRSLRTTELFHLPFRYTCSAQNSPLCRIVKHCNMYLDNFDPFSMSLTQVRRLMKRFLTALG